MSVSRWLLAAGSLGLVLALAPLPASAHPAVTLDVPPTVSGPTAITVTTAWRGAWMTQILVDGKVQKQCRARTCRWTWQTGGVPDGEHRVAGRASGGILSLTTRARVVVANAPEPTPSPENSLAPAAESSPPPGNVYAAIFGPQLAIHAAGDRVATYDATLLELGQRFASAFPEHADDLISSNYYDLALVLYTIAYRTRDWSWVEQARRVARLWRDSENNQAIPAYLGGDWSRGALMPPPRSLSTLGLAVLALETGDEQAREVVHLHARLVEQRWVYSGGDYGLDNPVMPLGDPREAGYGLIALVASTLLGEDHTTSARQLLDAILARQHASGQWQGWVEGGHVYTNNFMTGILMEALALYDRALGDPRIVPAIERAMAWTWNTQWVASTQSFRYDAEGSDPTPAPALNGLFLAGWAHAYARTGNAEYRAQGEEIFTGLVDRGLDEIWGVKQFSQVYRSSGQYLGVR